MYKANAARKKQEASFGDYKDYLRSLEMVAEIDSFSPNYMARIAQLTNKSNQFNLTTKRCTQDEIECFASNPNYITLYGKLFDKFGDNGVVSVVFGHVDDADKTAFHIDLWLMSCRVLKRDMEFAMMDELVEKAKAAGVKKLVGYYYPTAKNAMVKDFYGLQGFTKVSEDAEGNTVWEYEIPEHYEKKQSVIEVN
jgi:FkbH-like protein